VQRHVTQLGPSPRALGPPAVRAVHILALNPLPAPSGTPESCVRLRASTAAASKRVCVSAQRLSRWAEGTASACWPCAGGEHTQAAVQDVRRAAGLPAPGCGGVHQNNAAVRCVNLHLAAAHVGRPIPHEGDEAAHWLGARCGRAAQQGLHRRRRARAHGTVRFPSPKMWARRTLGSPPRTLSVTFEQQLRLRDVSQVTLPAPSLLRSGSCCECG
jgi:hypothetical protein